MIDPVLDYDPKATHHPFDGCTARTCGTGPGLRWILRTHVRRSPVAARAPARTAPAQGQHRRARHAAALRAAVRPLDDRLPGRRFGTGCSRRRTFAVEALDTLDATILPASSYRCSDCVFVGDTVFMPDYGTARADFPGGDARTLHRSIRRLLALPPSHRLFTGHDYRPGGREAQWESTVEQQQAANPRQRRSAGRVSCGAAGRATELARRADHPRCR